VPAAPAGRDDVVIVKAGGVIASDSAAVADAEVSSVTFTVKLAVPAEPGVPEMVPLGERFNPGGGDPAEIDQTYGGVPPDTPNDCEYAEPTTPAGSDDVVTDRDGELIVRDSAAVADADAPSVTLTVKCAVPAEPGVPDIVPAADRFSPAGSDPAETVHEYGVVPPAAPSDCE
jgi:hypothetical protein